MSLGTLVDITTGDGAGLKATFDHVTHAASNAGIILIAAAGNDGFNFSNQRYIELPAMSRDVLAIVASTNPACSENLATGAACTPGVPTLPYYSNYGTPMNALAAPGGSYPAPSNSAQSSGWIMGACSAAACFNLGHTSYVEAMGTSASAPLVAGAAALLRAANPTWSAAAVVAALRSSAHAVPTLPVPMVDVAALVTNPHPPLQRIFRPPHRHRQAVTLPTPNVPLTATPHPFMRSFTLCASRSISSARRTTSSDSTFLSVFATSSCSDVASASSFSVSETNRRCRSSFRCLACFSTASPNGERSGSFPRSSGLPLCEALGIVPGVVCVT